MSDKPHPPVAPIRLSSVPKAPKGLKHDTTKPPRAVHGLQVPEKQGQS